MFTRFKHVKIGEQFTIRFPDAMGGVIRFRRTPEWRNVGGRLYNAVDMDGKTMWCMEEDFVKVTSTQVERMKR